jgi:hypothetical protein
VIEASAFALLLVATYYLLASIPFSYYHFLQFAHFWWLPMFIRLHPFVMLTGTAGLMSSARPRSTHRYLAIIGSTVAASMFVTSWWPALQTYEYAAAMAFAPLGLICAAGWLNVLDSREVVERTRGRNRTDTSWRLESAVLAGATAAAIYLARAALEQRSALGPSEILAAGAISIAAHVLLFLSAISLVVAAASLAARRAWTGLQELVAINACTTAILAMFIRRSILTALILGSPRAIALAIVVAEAIVISVQASLVRRSTVAQDADVIRASLLPLGRSEQWRPRLLFVSAVVLVLTVALLPRLLLLADWARTLQKMLVVASWIAALAFALALPCRRSVRRAVAAVVTMAVAIVMAGSVVFTRGQPATDGSSTREPFDVSLALERYTTFDTSFTVLLDLLRPVLTDSEFFETLRREGDVTDNRSLPAVPLRVSTHTSLPAGTTPPHIFLIVIDSLRPDYVSAYNRQVTFTPAVGALAADSFVMRNAFTPYTGTALSEPALWAGALIPRAMYVKPFSVVNNLERLIEVAGYRAYVSVDEILSTILSTRSSIVNVDADLSHPERRDEMFRFDLCKSLGELTKRLDTDDRGGRPIFFYTQPQNLHIRVLAGNEYPRYEGVRVGSTEFFRPAADALARIDTCIGTFIEALKGRRLYDDSVIVLTSDHGDSYGEDGRWGHAFYTVPDTVRVPLIVHVPPRLLRGRSFDPDALSLLTDLTPTLYDLAGVQPDLRNDLLGRSLLVPVSDTANRARPFLLQSSYSRIFGLLDPHGAWMYTANANQLTEQLFDLRGGGRPRSIGRADRVKYRTWLLERIEELNAYYAPSRYRATASQAASRYRATASQAPSR